MTKNLVRVDVSQPQHIPSGALLGKMYYSGFIDKVLTSSEGSGYPHNGGSHSLYLRLAPADLKAFLDCVQETFKGHAGVSLFVESVTATVAQHYPGLALQ